MVKLAEDGAVGAGGGGCGGGVGVTSLLHQVQRSHWRRQARPVAAVAPDEQNVAGHDAHLTGH